MLQDACVYGQALEVLQAVLFVGVCGSLKVDSVPYCHRQVTVLVLGCGNAVTIWQCRSVRGMFVLYSCCQAELLQGRLAIPRRDFNSLLAAVKEG
jgi:hypothetical protein